MKLLNEFQSENISTASTRERESGERKTEGRVQERDGVSERGRKREKWGLL